MKQLSIETITERNISNKKESKIIFTDFNDNIKMNRMLIQATKKSGALKEGRSYTLDIDATLIPTERRGGRFSQEVG